jgi:hypothetical protein
MVTVLLWTVIVILLMPAFALAVKLARWITDPGEWHATLTGMITGAITHGVVYSVPHFAGLAPAAMLAVAAITPAAPASV